MFKIFVLFLLVQAEQPVFRLELELGDRFKTEEACQEALATFEDRWRASNKQEGILNWRWAGADCIDVGAPA